MNIIFWQNTLSIHQSAFVRNLAEKYKVTLIAESEIQENRKKSGWEIPDFGNSEILIKPKDDEMECFFKNNETIHVFSGIDAFPMVFKAFKLATKRKSKIWVQSEPYNYAYGKTILRLLKYKFLGLKYRNKIDGILAISNKALECYTAAGFHRARIYDWAYFTESPKLENDLDNKVDKSLLPRLIFVGSLDQRKNLLTYLPTLKNCSAGFSELSIYGSGELQNVMKHFESDKIRFYGNISNSEIIKQISKSDLLILPSKFDGWGAVVNEALMVGTRVLCSENCGASDLISEDRGRIFNLNNSDFEKKLKELIIRGKIDQKDRMNIMSWSNSKISGSAAVNYFDSILKFEYSAGNNRPVAPWKLL